MAIKDQLAPMSDYYPGLGHDDGWAKEIEKAHMEQKERAERAKEWKAPYNPPAGAKEVVEIVVASPSHYRFGNNLQTIDLIYEVLAKQQDGFLAYCLGNIFKYLTRYGRKDGLRDLKKAYTYLGWMIEHVEKGQISHE